MAVDRLSRQRSGYQFWLLQLIGWGAWVGLLVVRDLTFVPAEYMLDRVEVFALDALVGVVLTTMLRYLYRYVWEMASYIRVITVLLGCLAGSLIWQPIKQLIISTEFGASVDLSGYGWISFQTLVPFSFSLLMVWSVLYFCIKYYQLFQLEKEKYLRSEALAHEAQLRMLRYQLNPHFLFNTLNAISTLVLQGAGKAANGMLTKLSQFLRHSLEHDPLEQVELARELMSVRLYLDIEKVRFEERMRIEFNISPEAEKALVPSMLLQPLLENSVKYAIARSENGGEIRISAYTGEGRLVLEVADDGPDEGAAARGDSPESCGVGLQNIRDRLREIYGNNHQLLLRREQPRGFKATVIIPYETQ